MTGGWMRRTIMTRKAATLLVSLAAAIVASGLGGATDEHPTITWASAAYAKSKRPKPGNKKKTPRVEPQPTAAPDTPLVPAQAASAGAPTPAMDSGTASTPVSEAAPSSAELHAETSTPELLQRARALYASMEYEAVLPLAEAVLARADATIDLRLDAYLLQGSSLAIVGDAVEAEKPFRFLLRGRAGYDMPAETPPKILAVFRKVQVEERAIAEQMRELELARIVRELAIDSQVETQSTGGRPFTFAYKLKDPGRAVQTMNVHYRRSAKEPFSALALQVDDTGTWRAELPGELTENTDGFDLEYYVTTKDGRGRDLLGVGDAAHPWTVRMSPGTVADARPIYRSPWLWLAVGVAAAGAGVGGWVLYEDMTKLPDTDGFVRLKE